MILRPKFWLIVSVLTMAVSVAIIVIVRPVWGIDFTGGSLLEITVPPGVEPATIRNALTDSLPQEATVQTSGAGSVLIRTAPLSDAERQRVTQVLREKNLMGEELRFESIGPTIGQELRQKSWRAIALVLLVLMGYFSYEFRQMRGLTRPWKFGVATTYALVHDLLLVTALFVILGKVAHVPIDTLFVTAQLAILGYSVNDTIVIFNRFKAAWLATRSGNMLAIMDRAISDTLMRSFNTALSTLIALVAVLLFGGTTVRWFVVALVAGIVTGTYSSIFVAAPLLHYLSRRS